MIIADVVLTILLAIAFVVIAVTVTVEVVKSLSSEYTSWKSDRQTRKEGRMLKCV